MRQRWSARLLQIVGMRLAPRGTTIAPGVMLVANHVSWLDIFVINAIAPAAFVSKAEVRNWPAIGWLAAKNDTLFLRRGSRGHARVVSTQIAGALEDGRTVALFPEGTTTDGTHVLHFHGGLLQPALDAGHPVQPLALRYRRPDGSYCAAPAYYGDMSLIECIANIVGEPEMVAEVEIMEAQACDAGTDRRALAATLHARIASVINDADEAASPIRAQADS